MISFSRLSNDPALLFEATIAVIAKLILTLTELLPISTTSMYGESGTTTMAGGIGDSGTLGYTLADNALNALAKAARVSETAFAGTYCTTVSTSKNGISNVDTRLVKLRPIRYGVEVKSTPSI